MLRQLQSALLLVIFILVSGCVVFTNRSLTEGITNFRAENYRVAFIRLLPEAERGNPDAMYAVGYMYYYGRGVVEDRNKAWVWINRAAAAGQPDAKQAVSILNMQHQLTR